MGDKSMSNAEQLLTQVQELDQDLQVQHQKLQAVYERALHAAGLDIEAEVQEWFNIIVENDSLESVLRVECLRRACDFELRRRAGEVSEKGAM
jgi:hypothetical protein